MNHDALTAAALTATAVLLAWPDRRRLRSVLATDRSAGRAPGRVSGLLAGRPGAPPLRRRLWLASLAGAALCYESGRLVDRVGDWVWTAWPALVLTGVVVLGRLEPGSARVRQRRLVQEVPQALELMAACLAVGSPLRRACAAVVEAFEGPVAEDLSQVLQAVAVGIPDAQAWRALARHPQLGPAALDLARSVESGAGMVESLRAHAATARERRRAALQQAARSVGVRSVLPLMACFLPAFLLLGVVPTVVSAVVHAFH